MLGAPRMDDLPQQIPGPLPLLDALVAERADGAPLRGVTTVLINTSSARSCRWSRRSSSSGSSPSGRFSSTSSLLVELGDDDRLLVLDDGAYFVEAAACFARRFGDLRVVEQTTHGIIKLRAD